jgi:hypothetical protein
MGPSGEPGEIRTCARLPAVVRDRRAIVWACFGPILRISLRAEVKRASSPMPAPISLAMEAEGGSLDGGKVEA